MLWNMAVVLIAVGLTLFVLRTAFRVALLRETDQLLREDATEIELAAMAMHPDIEAIHAEITRHTESHRHRGLFVQLFDINEKPIWTSRGAGKDPLPLRPHLKKNGLFSSDSYRSLDKDMEGEAAQSFHGFRVGSDLHLVEEDVRDLTWLMMASMGIVVLLVPVGAYLVAVRATRPVAEIIDTTMKMRPQKLEERFPVRGTGDELDRLSETINGFLDRIAKFLRSNREFVANAAHELRSPLAAIGAAAELALSRDRSSTEYKEVLSDISDKCEHFRVLVNQLLIIAEAESVPALIAEKVCLTDIVVKSLGMFRDVAEHKEIELEAHIGRSVMVEGYSRLVQQLVNNLLDNAIKYTPEHGQIKINLTREWDKVILKVEDNGVGISSADLPHVFDRFFRSDRSRQREGDQPGGFGLGLSICKAVVESMGGTISVGQRSPRGSVFTVRWPAPSEVVFSNKQ